MKTLMTSAIALFALTGAALAEDCTPELAQERSEALFAYIEENPSAGEKLEQAVKDVEAEYGGEPSEAQTCEAIDKLIAKLQSAG